MTSMAAFPPPAGMQYAGQQMAGMMPMMMPMAGFPGEPVQACMLIG
jgi:hypothetical protein